MMLTLIFIYAAIGGCFVIDTVLDMQTPDGAAHFDRWSSKMQEEHGTPPLIFLLAGIGYSFIAWPHLAWMWWQMRSGRR